MPKFVPVTDPELPKSEQDFLSKDLIRHRKWDNPHTIINRNNNNNVNRDNHLSKYHDREPVQYKNRNVIDEFDYKTPKKRKRKNTDDKMPTKKSSNIENNDTKETNKSVERSKKEINT